MGDRHYRYDSKWSGAWVASTMLHMEAANANAYANVSGPPAILNGDFCVEAWVYLDNATIGTPYGIGIAGSESNSTNGWQLRLQNDGLAWVYPGAAGVTKTHTWSAGIPFHVMACRVGTQHYLGINGDVDAVSIGNRTTGGSTVIRVGAQSYGGFSPEGTRIALRVTKFGRYTADFTPPLVFPQE